VPRTAVATDKDPEELVNVLLSREEVEFLLQRLAGRRGTKSRSSAPQCAMLRGTLEAALKELDDHA